MHRCQLHLASLSSSFLVSFLLSLLTVCFPFSFPASSSFSSALIHKLALKVFKFSASVVRAPYIQQECLFVSLVPSRLSECLTQKQEFLLSLIEA